MERHHGESKPNGKTLRTRLQRQLEFYLSASNLRQDKFLQQSMDELGFVPITIFLAFNKLKALKATEKMVRDAAAKSSLIRINVDQSAIAPVELPFDTEDTSQERTVYIENFGVADDHDSLRKRFSKFGKASGGSNDESPTLQHVNLVSMPRFPQSKRFKGFAFVEFASTQAAEALLAATLTTDPELQGVRAMSKVQWQELKQQLKEQLTSAALQEAEAEVRGIASSTRSASVELREEEDGEPNAENLERASAPKKRKNDHIRFAADEDESEIVLQQSEMHDVTKKMKRKRHELPRSDTQDRFVATIPLFTPKAVVSAVMCAMRFVLCAATCATLARAQPGVESADLESEHDVFTPEPERVFQPFYVPGWTNAYVPNVTAACSGAVAGFADKPLVDTDCLAPFQFLLERGTDKVRYGCFKCGGAFLATPAAAPYATCDGRPICSGFSLAYYHCFLQNDRTSDMFACLMGVDFQADR